jgi:hypothetical protein
MTPMLRRKGRERTRLCITDWHLGCPRRGDVELEECLSCGYLDLIDGAQQPRYVECRWRGPDLAGMADLFATLGRRS